MTNNSSINEANTSHRKFNNKIFEINNILLIE